MDEVKEFIVIEEEEGDRLDVYLSEQLGEMCIRDRLMEISIRCFIFYL